MVFLGKILSRKVPCLRKALSKSSNRLCRRFFAADVMYEPVGNSTEISKSPHREKRFETKDPNGSTMASVYIKKLINLRYWT